MSSALRISLFGVGAYLMYEGVRDAIPLITGAKEFVKEYRSNK